jgi:hypothetical protein
MQDGAPAHFSPAVRDVLNNACYDRWTGRGGSTAWPPRSPDFNPLYFHLWGHLNILVYAAPVDNEEAYHIVESCQTIRKWPGIFMRMRLSMMGRVEVCTKSHGGHFVDCYKCVLSDITLK